MNIAWWHRFSAPTSGEDDHFRDFAGAIQSVVTSTAQNDSGLFELNLRDERRLPFDGAGAISTWHIELPNDVPQFDFESISDVVLHMRYTAREAGNLRADAVQYLHDHVLQDPGTLAQLFSLNYDFPDVWRPFVRAMDDAHRTMTLSVTTDHFPYWVITVGMSDQIIATFAVIDAAKHKLSVAPASLPFAGNAASGWTLTIDQLSPVFAFLKKYRASTVHMTISYMSSV